MNESQVLQIQPVYLADAGVFQCTVHFRATRIVASIILHTIGKLIVTFTLSKSYR